VRGFVYVYILRSLRKDDREQFYGGFTYDLDDRLRRHNRGMVPHTAKYIPWAIKSAVAFDGRTKVEEFERY